MNTFLKKISVFGAFSVGLFSAGEIAFANNSPIDKENPVIELKNFPDLNLPEAVYKNVEKIYTFDADGACEFRFKSELRVNTLFAMNELCGETFVVYNPKFQRVKINEAYTIMADGTRVDVPRNAFNTVLPKCAADAPAFNFLRELVITHTALEPGATIFLDYSVFYANVEGMLFDEYADMPFPCDRLVLNFNGSQTEFFNVPARSRETFFHAKRSVPVIYPGMKNVKPRDFCSTENVKLGESGKARLAKLIEKPGMTHDEKICAIYDFVSDKIATVKIPSALLSESDLRLPDAVIASAYGTPLEKARVLWSMLSAAGLKDCKIICNEFEDAFFVDVPEVKARLGVGASGEKKLVSVSGLASIEFSDESMNVSGELDVDEFDSERDARKRAQVLTGISGGSLQANWRADNVKINFSYTQKLSVNEGVLVWTVPVSPKGITAIGVDKLPRERKSLLVLPSARNVFSETYYYKIRLGENYCLAEAPRTDSVENNVGRVLFSLESDGGEVRISKDLVLSKLQISPKDYAAFRELLTAWFAPRNNRVMFFQEDEK